MLKHELIHPDILLALGRAGHGSRVLISDGNYPHATARGRNAALVFLNLSPGRLNVTEVLAAIVTAIPIEAAALMDTNKSGPYQLNEDPAIWSEIKTILKPTDCSGNVSMLERFEFYEAAAADDVCLTVATGEQRIYANVLLTIGVRR